MVSRCAEQGGVLRFVFFFQAEDGIRDYKVRVQTCALPISVKNPFLVEKLVNGVGKSRRHEDFVLVIRVGFIGLRYSFYAYKYFSDIRRQPGTRRFGYLDRKSVV